MPSLELSEKKRTLVFTNIVITCVAASLLSTALTVAMKPISVSLGIELKTAQWLTSGYNLAMGITMPLTAFLVRRVRTRSLYIAGIGIYLLGLLIAFFSFNFSLLITGRIFQAAGNGILLSVSQVVILSVFPPEKKGTAMGWYGLALTAAPVFAPTLSGVLVDFIGWRSIFAFSFVIMLVAFIMALIVMQNVLDTKPVRFDALSFTLSVVAFGGITLGAGNLAGFGITSMAVFPALIVGSLSFIVFAYRQISLETPFLNLRILKTQEYTVSVIGNMLLYFVMYGSSLLTPLFFQDVMGRPATVSGLLMLPGSVAIAIISPFAGKIFDRFGIKPLFVAGSAAMLISNIGMSLLTLKTPLVVASILYCVRSFCIGFMLTPLVTWGTSCVEKSVVADATAVINSFRTIAGSIGGAVFVGIMTSSRLHFEKAMPLDEASMSGMNFAYASMSALTFVLLLIAIFAVKGKQKKSA